MSIVKNKKGFTLIELVIVLAIAALILAAVLIAVTGAQKSRRDTQRKNDIATMASYVEQWGSNHSGDYPTAGQIGQFTTAYLGPAANNMKDPSTGANYNIAFSTATPGAAGNVSFSTNATCNGNVAVAGGGLRKYAIVTYLEQGGSACNGN